MLLFGGTPVVPALFEGFFQLHHQSLSLQVKSLFEWFADLIPHRVPFLEADGAMSRTAHWELEWIAAAKRTFLVESPQRPMMN